jgi:3-oxoacyl-[acyl-carrier protein] reductase
VDLGLQGRRAAVAAASSGLGLASAMALAAEGAHVVVCGRDQTRLDRAVVGRTGHIETLVADVATAAGAREFVAAARERLGGLDVLVTNGPGPAPGTVGSTPIDAYPEALESNLTAQVAMCLAAIEPMRAQRWGRIVAITSIAVRQPIANLVLSNTARAGYTGFLKTLAREVAADGVTVNSLQPGLHLTDRLRALHGDIEALVDTIPARRLGDPGDFGSFVTWLCSEQAGFVTGAHIPVDGGSYAALL